MIASSADPSGFIEWSTTGVTAFRDAARASATTSRMSGPSKSWSSEIRSKYVPRPVSRSGGRFLEGFSAGGRIGDDEEPTVKDSSQGRQISEALMSYLVSFLRDGRPTAKDLAEWLWHTAAAPRTMVFGNGGMAVR
jgi:hypothetical protein